LRGGDVAFESHGIYRWSEGTLSVVIPSDSAGRFSTFGATSWFVGVNYPPPTGTPKYTLYEADAAVSLPIAMSGQPTPSASEVTFGQFENAIGDSHLYLTQQSQLRPSCRRCRPPLADLYVLMLDYPLVY